MKKRGRIFVLMGPSGVGKTTLVKEMIKRFGAECSLAWLPTYTTREAREGEVFGVDYFFITPERFQQMQQAGKLLEWSSHYKALYGTGRDEVEAALAQGKNVLLAIDRQGAGAVKKLFPSTRVVLVVAPSEEVLKQRISKRTAQSEEVTAFRLERAREELKEEAAEPLADEVLVNNQLEEALEALKKVISGTVLSENHVSF
ncbi:MAG: Guanylate kinase [candidate division TM6 bacterium GW2011_GWE2_42_60]|nr:MAG: Guanylate kinase [candidate division TM6 bacterium GW2011_GWE2_42_60]HBY05488.1 guanylate kinase [Candidatus Dependentiae bacterium]